MKQTRSLSKFSRLSEYTRPYPSVYWKSIEYLTLSVVSDTGSESPNPLFYFFRPLNLAVASYLKSLLHARLELMLTGKGNYSLDIW